ncbi:C25 family cysteine peptidase [Prosthecochloris sp. CIB 2401]|uniref:C25 family cysteine peptidase n=1 Tax=Prosthecochloris sp. CIB 2401 TaxID=1868325 RepID=UPI00080AC10A|nr:C25 family cysteine peptidase [Prosthecochloris sp. CIB 2401]ANT64551.1 Gingipain R2 precursor [Prosthecochloris sp. CIB 2401]
MSKEFYSLKPAGISGEFDAELHGTDPVIELQETEEQLTISCIFPGFKIADTEKDIDGEKLPFKEVGIRGAGYLSRSGQPLMPIFRRFVQVPKGVEIELGVEKGRAVTFNDILVTPAQEEATDADMEHPFEYSAEAYARDEFYPPDIARVSDAKDIDAYNTVLVEICPLQCNAATKTLRGYSNITVTLRFRSAGEHDGEMDFSLSFMDPELSREGYGNLLLNPARSAVSRLEPALSIPELRLFTPEFLIIYHQNFKAAAEKLADWKKLKGISTQLTDIASVGNSVANIKNYVRDRRRTKSSRLRYVLLLGDTSHIVTESIADKASDYYYSTPNDASGSSDCVAPWLAIGRMPVQTANEAMDIVEQIIRYEKTPPCDPAYYDRITAAAYFQDDSPQDGKADRAYMKTMESIRSHLVALGKDVQRIYVSNNPNPQYYKDGTPIPADVKAAIVDGNTATEMLISETAEGQVLVGHRDHGGTSGWSHPSFTNNDLDSITSTYPSIFLSINCLTGRFDYSSAYDSFAESILKLKGGAPSLVAATRVSGTWRNDSLIKGLFDALYPGVIPTYPGTTASYGIKNNRLGDILNYAKMYLFVAHGTSSGVKGHLEIYHTIGDPTLELWKAMPLVLTLNVRVIRTNLLLQLGTAPKEGVITIRQGNRVLKTLKSASTVMQVPLRDLKLLNTAPGIRRQAIHVAFSAPGYRFIEKKVMF